jgi:hypothetical protein
LALEPGSPSAAYHEAGHAIVLWHFGLPFVGVSIRTTQYLRHPPPGGIGGGVSPDETFVPLPGLERLVDEMMVISLVAGVISQARFTKKSIVQTGARAGKWDMLLLQQLADRGTDHRIGDMAYPLLRAIPTAAATQSVANFLISERRASRSEIAELCRGAYDRATDPKYVDWQSHWPPTTRQLRAGWLPLDG